MTVLAFDGGGSVTRAGIYGNDRALLAEAEGGPSNPVAYGPEAAAASLCELGRRVTDEAGQYPAVIAAGLSGAGEQHAHVIIADALFEAFQPHRVILTGDALPILLANAGDNPAILAISGTGSCVVGRSGEKHVVVGGRGALFGEEGGAYGLARSALRNAALAVDGLGPSTSLVDALTKAVGVDAFNRICRWDDSASKRDVAALSQVVIRCADEGDGVALSIVAQHAFSLARQTEKVVESLAPDVAVSVFIQGGLVEHAPMFRQMYEESLASLTRHDHVTVPEIRDHKAVATMAWYESLPRGVVTIFDHPPKRQTEALSSTERRADDSVSIDRLDMHAIVERMITADEPLPGILRAQAASIAQAMQWAAEAIQSGRRIIYIGAGTSGRLGVLDASECPPTFGIAADRVVGIIAGGDKALRESVEGAEDDEAQGRADIAFVAPGDVVIGIAASGTTRYTRAALDEAATRGACTVLLCCNPAITNGANGIITLDTGPEILAGSTRLRAGTATKIALNIISTGAFSLAGYVHDGYMVGVIPVNDKLRARAERIVTAITGCDLDHARTCLEEAEYNVRTAAVMAARNCSADRARQIMDNTPGDWRQLLEVGDA